MNKMGNEKVETVKHNGMKMKVRDVVGYEYTGGGVIGVSSCDDDPLTVNALKNIATQKLDSFRDEISYDYDCTVHHEGREYPYLDGKFVGYALAVTGCSMAGISYNVHRQPIDESVLLRYEPVIDKAEQLTGKTLVERDKPAKELEGKLARFWSAISG